MARVSLVGMFLLFGDATTRRWEDVVEDINGGCAYLIINNAVRYVCASGDA